MSSRDRKLYKPPPPTIKNKWGLGMGEKILLISKSKIESNRVERREITKVSDLLPILVLCEVKNHYIRGMGFLIETEDGMRHCIQINSFKPAIEITNPEEQLIGKKFIIDYEDVGEIISVVKGIMYNFHLGNIKVKFARGMRDISKGVVYKEIPLYEEGSREYENMIPFLPAKPKIVPVNPYWEFEFEIENEEIKEEVQVKEVK